MKCFVCQWLRRLIVRDDPAWVEEADKAEDDFRASGLNTDAIFNIDPQADRLRELSKLWNSDPTEAFKGFLELAEAGSVWSMIRVGGAYARGEGTPQDRTLAERWFTSAFESGSDYGLIWSAYMALARGDVAKARATLEVGVKRGLPLAMTDLANLELKSAKTTEARSQARALFESANAQDFRPARVMLARAMASGALGWREIPNGIGRILGPSRDFGDLVEARKKQRLAN